MNESTKTITFAAVAAALVGFSAISHFSNKPTNSADFELVGKPFFEKFESAEQAQSLEVVVIDSESVKTKRFEVANKNGLWRIPSHYDYPAEAAARLATTASSVIGINRDSMAGRLAQEHEKFGVVDPLGEEIDDPDSVGKRIMLKDADGDVLVDYIIGKEAGEVVLDGVEEPFGNQANDEKYYYVRRPDEQQTYKVKLNVDLSAKFSDWIDPDLLRLERNQLTKILIDNYKLQEDPTRRALIKDQGDKLEVVRKTSTDAWELADLNADKEELNASRVNEIISVLDEMKIAGVRPKYKYKDHLLLTADLKLNSQPEFKENPQEFGRAIQRLQAELDQKGFSLAGSAEKMELVSQHGEIQLGTDKGMVYTLHVGKALEGNEEEIEVGLAKKDDAGDEIKNASAGEKDAGADGDPKNTEEQKTNPLADAKNRYLMVRVSFDDSLAGEKPAVPVVPVAPIKPENYIPEPEEKDEENVEAPEGVKAPDGGDNAAEEEEQEPKRNPESIKFDEDQEKFIDGRMEYEIAQSKYKEDLVTFEEKIENGKAAVKELNERFGDWYYVISADNLKTLQTVRKDLVTLKEVPEGEKVEGMLGRPDISFPEIPGLDGKLEEPKDGTDSEKMPEGDTDAEKKHEMKKEDPSQEKPEVDAAEDEAKDRDIPVSKKDTEADKNKDKGGSEKETSEKADAEKGSSEKSTEGVEKVEASQNNKADESKPPESDSVEINK